MPRCSVIFDTYFFFGLLAGPSRRLLVSDRGSTASLGTELQLAWGGRALSAGEVKRRSSGRYLPR